MKTLSQFVIHQDSGLDDESGREFTISADNGGSASRETIKENKIPNAFPQWNIEAADSLGREPTPTSFSQRLQEKRLKDWDFATKKSPWTTHTVATREGVDSAVLLIDCYAQWF